MDPEGLLDMIIDAEVIESTPDGLRVSQTFLTQVSRQRETFESTRNSMWLDANLPSEFVNAIADSEIADELACRYLTLDAFLGEGVDDKSMYDTLVLLQGLETDDSTGSPNPFFQVPCEYVSVLCSLYHRVTLYVWRTRCDPCDLMKATFDSMDPDLATGTVFISVNGEHCPQYLESQFSIGGAPVTAFIEDGEVQGRLVGAHIDEVVYSELRRFLDQQEVGNAADV